MKTTLLSLRSSYFISRAAAFIARRATCLLLVRAGFKPAPYRRTAVRLYHCLLLLLLPLAAFAQMTVCAGQGFMITSKADAQSISGGVTYTWHVSVNDGSYTVVDGQTAASLPVPDGQSEAGTYAYVRYAAGDACPNGVPTTPYTVVVQALPVIESVSATTVCAGSYTIITAEPALDNATYTWTACDNTWTTTSNTTTINACTATSSGSVSVESQCKSAISTYTVAVTQPSGDGTPLGPCGCAEDTENCAGTCRAKSKIPPYTTWETLETHEANANNCAWYCPFNGWLVSTTHTFVFNEKTYFHCGCKCN